MKKSIMIVWSILSISSAFGQIYAVGNGDGFAFSSAGSPGNLILLPVEHLAFNADCNGGKVILNWTTPTQINIDYYTIERTNDGVKFELIETKTVNNNSSHINNYTYADNQHFNGTLQYRLKIYSLNGKVKYLAQESISCGIIPEIKINPNPSSGLFIVDGLAFNSKVVIKNSLGQIVFQSEIIGEKVTIDLRNQENGIYLLEIESENGIELMKIVINNK